MHTQTQEAWQPGEFVKSSFSPAGQGDCVEVAGHAATVGVRDSKQSFATGPIIEFGRSGWAAFVSQLATGQPASPDC